MKLSKLRRAKGDPITAPAPHSLPVSPFGPARLKDADMAVDFESETTPDDIVSVIVTEPLTSDETWDVYRPGEWRLWRKGEVVMTDLYHHSQFQ